MPNRVLIVEDDEATLEAVSGALVDLGCSVARCTEPTSARRLLETEDFDVVVTDLRLPGMNGLELCDCISLSRPDLPVVLMTAFGDARSVAWAMRSRVVDFLPKPFSIDGLRVAIGRALEKRKRLTKVARLPDDGSDDDSPLPEMVGSSTPMRALARRVRKAARFEGCVLITGETGTGKELVGRAVHALSARAHGPFVALNCAALPAEIIESELFGHVLGSFTGAVRSRSGLFQAAAGGTLFLDEIGAMPFSLQSRLIRALDSGKVRAIGRVEEERADVHLVAATNAHLRDAATHGAFREDLLSRVSAFPLQIPPLRARGDDVIEIAQHFLRRFAPEEANAVLSEAASGALRRYPWPGNVRELENCIQAALVAAGSERIEPQHLPERVRENLAGDLESDPRPLDLEAVERLHIARVLSETGGNRSAAARKLGMNRVTLYRKLKRYRVE